MPNDFLQPYKYISRLSSVGGLRGAAYNWLETNLKKKNETLVSIHANFLKGNEAKMKVCIDLVSPLYL